MPTQTQDYRQLLTDVIKKQIVILGPDITLSKARNVKGLTIADDGTVTNVEGSPQEIIQALIDQFVQLSGLIVKKTMEPLLMATQQVADGEVSQTSPTGPAAPVPMPTPTASLTTPVAASPVIPAPIQPEAQPALPGASAQTVVQTPSVQPAPTQPAPIITAPAEQVPAVPLSPSPVQTPLPPAPAAPVAVTPPAAQPTTPEQPTTAQPANNPLAA